MNKPAYILLLLLCYFFTGALFAQQQPVFSRSFRPSFQKGTVKDFLEDINRRSGSFIEYANNYIDADKIIELKGTALPWGRYCNRY
jgi:hypothetical protein